MLASNDLTYRLIISLLFSALILPLFSGCATAPKEEQAAIFYPPLPNPPRLQFLTRFSNEHDLGGGTSSFGDFLLGSEKNMSPISKPYGVAVHDAKIYVVDSHGGAYAVFDLKNQKFKMVRGSGNGALSTPLNMAIDEEGNKYIADSAKRQVVVFDANDEFVRAYGEEGQFKPTDVALLGDRLYVCDLEHSTIQVLDKKTGVTLFRISGPGKGEGELGRPTNIDIANGKLYVSDTIHARVQTFTLDGEYISVVGSYGTGMGQLARPKGIAVDRDDNLYVVDAAFQNVQIFSKDGELLLFFGGVDKRDSITLPSTVVIDYDDVEYFQQYVEPNFQLEYVVLVASQYGGNKVVAFGFGKMEGMDYTLPSEE